MTNRAILSLVKTEEACIRILDLYDYYAVFSLNWLNVHGCHENSSEQKRGQHVKMWISLKEKAAVSFKYIFKQIRYASFRNATEPIHCHKEPPIRQHFN